MDSSADAAPIASDPVLKPRSWRKPYELLRNLLKINDTPRSIAMGAAVGTFVGLTPTGGIQTLLVVGCSLTLGRMVRFNFVSAMIGLYVSNPFTAIPIYWLSYQAGNLFFHAEHSLTDFASLAQFQDLQLWWHNLVDLMFDVGAQMLLGSLVVGGIGAIVTYAGTLWLVNFWRSRRQAPQPVLVADSPAQS